MKLLYYSTAYHASHGGSLQSVAFYREAIQNPLVSQLTLFPATKQSHTHLSHTKGTLRRFLRSISLFQIFFLFRRNRMLSEQICAEIETTNPDVVLIQLDSTFYQALKLKRKFPQKIIASIVNASPFDEPFKNVAFLSWFKKWERRCLAQLDVNIFISNHLRHKIMSTDINDSRDFVVHNGVDFNTFFSVDDKETLRKKLNLSPTIFIVGYVGTLDHHKRVDVLINAFIQFSENDENCQLIIVGDGPARSTLEQYTRTLSSEKKILFTGWLKHEQINEYINSFSVAVHHHAQEYMSPLKIFEYLATKIPVIAPRIPAIQEIFKEDEHLLMTNPTVEEIVTKLKWVEENSDTLIQIQEAAYRYIHEKYSWARHASSILEIVKSKLI